MVEMLHMLAQSWPNFKNLESLHSTVLYSKNKKKSLPFPFFGIFKMSIKAVMRRESFSDSCVNTCRKWPSVPFTQNLKYPTRTVYKVCAFCPNLRHPRASYPQDSDKRLFLIPLLTACSAQNLHVLIFDCVHCVVNTCPLVLRLPSTMRHTHHILTLSRSNKTIL